MQLLKLINEDNNDTCFLFLYMCVVNHNIQVIQVLQILSGKCKHLGTLDQSTRLQGPQWLQTLVFKVETRALFTLGKLFLTAPICPSSHVCERAMSAEKLDLISEK